MTEALKRRMLAIERAKLGLRPLEDDEELDNEGTEGEEGGDEPILPEEPEVVIGYVTVAEANQYISEHYLMDDELRVNWDALDDESKKVLLRRSLLSIELLPYIGQKTGDDKQELQFPRCPSTEIPWQVKAAQIENALSKSDADIDEDTKFYERLWTWGVQSYTLGKLSERVSSGGWGSALSPLGTAQETGITSAIAARLLRPFLMGGYTIV